jgi:hypothetical protein
MSVLEQSGLDVGHVGNLLLSHPNRKTAALRLMAGAAGDIVFASQK